MELISKTSSPEEVQERLNYYYEKLNSCDEEEQEDQQTIHFLKERISYWRMEQLKVEEHLYFGHLNKELGII